MKFEKMDETRPQVKPPKKNPQKKIVQERNSSINLPNVYIMDEIFSHQMLLPF
jgi:hypothetical protein